MRRIAVHPCGRSLWSGKPGGELESASTPHCELVLNAVGMRIDEGSKWLSNHTPPRAMRPAGSTGGRVFTNTPRRVTKAPSAFSPVLKSSLAALYKAQMTAPMTTASRICFHMDQFCQGD